MTEQAKDESFNVEASLITHLHEHLKNFGTVCTCSPKDCPVHDGFSLPDKSRWVVLSWHVTTLSTKIWGPNCTLYRVAVRSESGEELVLHYPA
jgi:hypothetical protein